jgi:segregation and condensation protein A
MEQNNSTNEKIYSVLFEKDDVTWQSIIYELVKSEKIDPWNVDISLLTKKYISMIKELKEFDFKVSGKALLAAAILLKIKSKKLVGEDLDEFDRIISGEQDDDFFEEDILKSQGGVEETQNLIPRLPQPRKRKVSIYDLMGALEKALEVKQRRVLRQTPSFNVEIPNKKPNVHLVVKNVYLRIKRFFLLGNKDLTFSKLVPTESTKEDKVFTFIPLLHLANKRKVHINQNEPFGEISIRLNTENELEEELKGLNEK